MNRSSFEVDSKQQAAMAANVLRVILNNLTVHHHSAHILLCNHSIGPRHLPDGMREEQEFPARGTALRNATRLSLLDIVLPLSISSPAPVTRDGIFVELGRKRWPR
jgi:hypothetical protein